MGWVCVNFKKKKKNALGSDNVTSRSDETLFFVSSYADGAHEGSARVFQPISLVLLDITPMLPVLDGVVMELQDCALPLLRGELMAPPGAIGVLR